MLPTVQAGTVEGEESRSERVKPEMFARSPRGEIKSGEERIDMNSRGEWSSTWKSGC